MEDIDVALERLGMLSTVTNARRDFLNEMRLRGVRSQTSCDFSWRRKKELCSSEESQDDWYSLPIKENLGMEKMMVYGGNKRRVRLKSYRSLPYDINRRNALTNTLISPMSRLGLTSSPTLPLILQEHQPPLPGYYDVLNKTRKTEKFPVPLLSRSKSLEDLRESPNKSKATRFQLLHCDDSSDGSCNGSNSVESPLSLSPRNSFLNVLKGEASIKQEIDSMSMRIKKLDVT